MRSIDVKEILKRHGAALAEIGMAAELREFDSDVLAVPVVALASKRPLPRPAVESIARLIDDLPAGCLLSARLAADEVHLRESLEGARFRLVECYLSLRHSLQSVVPPQSVLRLAEERDIAALERVARASFSHSRWHCDRYIPKRAADESRARWAVNAVKGRAEAVFVTDDEEGACGFVCCMTKPVLEGHCGVLDLIAVAPRARGAGLGRALVRQFLVHCRDAGRAFAEVGTQVHNYGAVRLYESEGFKLNAAYYTYHCHVGR